ncbi:unnamed protein product [Hydatigera taeniaeformis]|uniref:Uncharacterized protein n=1 Tax=Hydatigena taeniaeformis TaxID=6205 RepID=A0A0R3WMR1_HYDTA|nr:unnamed protein product [Hydatigera taeniaeformis]
MHNKRAFARAIYCTFCSPSHYSRFHVYKVRDLMHLLSITDRSALN